MKSKILLSSVILMFVVTLPGLLLAAVTGKIAGKVFDLESKEPLVGANVTLEGTLYGAATNVNGEYIILNVPPGTYSLKAQFIGYRSVTVKNILVSVDITTNFNFDLPTEALAMSSIVVVAERPLIQKSATNEMHILTADEIGNIPLRSYAAVVATSPGVVAARADMHVRGGRRDEVAYYVDGVYSNNLRDGRRIGDIPINSVEQINYQAGGFTAEYGFANSGVVVTSSKAGEKAYQISGEIVTDEFLSESKKNLGTYSFGYNVYNVAVSGPIVTDKVKFFAAAEQNFLRDRTPTSQAYPALDGDFTQDEINLDRAALEGLGVPQSEWILPVKYMGGVLPHNSLKRWSFNGNLMLDLKSLKFKVGGHGTFDKFDEYIQSYAINSLSHAPTDEQNSYSFYGKVTHALSPTTFYDATGYYSDFSFERMDPVFERHVVDYGDATDFNNNGIFAPYLTQDGLNSTDKLRLGTGVFRPEMTWDDYDLQRNSVIGAKLDLTHQMGTVHEFKGGFEYRYNTMRRYYVGRPVQLAGVFATTPNIDPRLAYRTGYTENYGYPVNFHNDIVDPSFVYNSGDDEAKHPIIAAFYLQDKIELSDLIVNLGLRVDYIDANDRQIRDPYNIVIKQGFLDESNFESTEGTMTVSPRIGLSFPVTDKTVFHAQWGKFTQQPELQYLYTGWDYYAAQVSQGNQVAIGNPSLEPVKTTAYEIGFGQQLGLNASFNVTAYYKEIRDLIVLKNRVNARPATYAQYQNGDFGTVKGLSLNFRMRRTQRITANLNYSLQWARGTGSTAGSAFYITWIGNEYYPTFIAPLDYDQRHTLSLNVDYRTTSEDGPKVLGIYPFGDMGLNILAQIGSGFPYTPKVAGETVFTARFSTSFPTAATNSAYTNWTYDVGLRLDKTIRVGKNDFNVYLWVLNLFDVKQAFNRRSDRGQEYGGTGAEIGIYEATGRPDDNGWLDTVEGQAWLEDNGGARAEEMYRARINDPRNWEAPRQIRLGLRFNINP